MTAERTSADQLPAGRMQISDEYKTILLAEHPLFREEDYAKCPMTIENTAIYKVSKKEERMFCNKGCCPICYTLFLEKFGRRKAVI